jgi:hypothetical protein
MTLDEQDKFIQHIMANHNTGWYSRVNDSDRHKRRHCGGKRSRRRGFCQIQQVNSTPPLSSYNHFTCLEVDTLIESHTCIAKTTEVVQTPSHPPIPNRRSRIPAWERQLPIKYVVAASPGLMSLLVTVETESTDTTVK